MVGGVSIWLKEEAYGWGSEHMVEGVSIWLIE